MSSNGRRRLPGAAAIAVAALLGTASCSTSGAAAPDPLADHGLQHVTIDGNDAMRFVPDRVVVQPGTVVVTLHDVGQEAHNIDFPSLHVKSPLISAGKSTSVTLHVRAGHTYTFDCDIHISEGMIGTLVVPKSSTGSSTKGNST